MSLLKEMLLVSPKVDHIKSSMDLDNYLLSQDICPVDVQPVSPDVLAKGAEDLLFDGNIFSIPETTETKHLLEDLDQLGQDSLLDDFLDGPVDLEGFLSTLCEPGPVGPELEQLPSALADLSDFDVGALDVDSLLGLRHENMDSESSDSGIASPEAAAAPVVNTLQTADYTSFSPTAESVVEEQPGMYVELESVCAPSPPLMPSGAALVGTPVTGTLVMVKREVDPTAQSHRSGVRYNPYRRPLTKAERGESKKERKRLQNQQAAIRYRQKKKQESDTIQEQASALRRENTDLDDKVQGLEKEIKYMKDLLLEVYKAKGMLKRARKLERTLRD